MSENSNDEGGAYEACLRRRLEILKQELDAGRVKFAPGLRVIQSLKEIRTNLDGSVDLNTVDSLVRSLALAVEATCNRREIAESVSLQEVQETYFQYIEANFGPFYDEMIRKGSTPHGAGQAFSTNPNVVAQIAGNLPDFLKTIEEFWSSAGEAAHIHVEDFSDSFKGVFGGDLFPSPYGNIASKCGLYLDTVVLPDPFLRTKHLFECISAEKKTYYAIKHGTNLLKYKDLACAQVNPPIVVVLPDRTAIEVQEKEFFHNLGKMDAANHASKVFGREFVSFDDLMEFAATLTDVDRVVAEVSDADRLLFDTEWDGGVRERLVRALGPGEDNPWGTSHPGLLVASHFVGRMSISNELLVKAQRVRGVPLVEAETSWRHFAWKLEYDAIRSHPEAKANDVHILRGLQSLADTDMQWLGAIPASALIEVRKTGAMAEIRSILGKGASDISVTNPINFHRTADKVFDNIQAAFKEHQKQIDELSAKKWKFAGTEVATWLTVGTLAAVAAATGQPVWALAALAAEQIIPAPKLREIPKSIRELAEQSEQLKRSPMGLLFNCASRKT